MTASVADLRNRKHAECAFLWVPDGLPYAWVTDHSTISASGVNVAALLGSGVGTWSDTLPSSIGPRTILRGLVLPTFHESFDVKTGLLDNSQVTIKLVDFDGVLNDLLATEGKDADVLSEDIQPGTAALGTSVVIQGSGTVNPRGRHIGLERIGPSGERCYFSCFPFTRIGPHHPVNIFGPQGEGPPPIPISTEPLVFTGRWCALYRLYKDPNATGVSAWPDLQEQYDAGGLVWWGKMMDRGSVDAERVWSISVEGPASFLRKTCNQWSFSWKPFNADVTLSDDERLVGIEFLTTNESTTTAELEVRNSIGFLAAQMLSATGDRDTWVAELNSLLANVRDGTLTDYGPDGNLDDFHGSDVSLDADGSVRVLRPDEGDSVNGAIECRIVVHEKVWRTFGFDPPLQDTSVDEVDEFHVRFKRISQGQNVSATLPESGGSTPGANYWRVYTHSAAIGQHFVPGNAARGTQGHTGLINHGSPRLFSPIHTGEMTILPENIPSGGIPLRLSIDTPFLEGQPTAPFREASEVNGTPCNRAGYFVVRGKRQPATVTVDGQVFDKDGNAVNAADVESEDEYQVIRASWVEA